jgi:hypothetical protein
MTEPERSDEERIAEIDRIVSPIRGVGSGHDADKALRRADELPARPQLTILATATVADVLVKILNGKIKVQNASQAKQLIEVCYGIVRLEAGEATSITQMNTAEIMESIKNLRDKARRDARVTPRKVV